MLHKLYSNYLKTNSNNILKLSSIFSQKSFNFNTLIMSEISKTDTQKNLIDVKENILNLKNELNLNYEPKLIAVSKTKPIEQILECYEQNQRYFGENYVQELCEKAPQLPDDIKWHFIGRLQSNKCKIITKIKNLDAIETVSSTKLVKTLVKELKKVERDEPLKVFIQVNTSKEENKSGCSENDIESIYDTMNESENKNYLKFVGLMCIGRPGEPSDMETLVELRSRLCENKNLEIENVELSMGMSSDYETAIKLGSTNVRVGSTIFGARNYPAKNNNN
eukprot:TRINITY_DN2292_c0_g1_i2.p1 TRINITY_DN2292_c0_g1~~TRINITY_DN2292_c0_g1_i2.p1  ORF type:complete len:279 (-),score=64.89 TRINITY_DN2292_c0_g1_i2:215-1051(-)